MFRDISDKSEIGDYIIILANTKKSEEVLRARPKKKSKRPESDLQHVLWKIIETRPVGQLDPEQSGLDHANKYLVTSINNWKGMFNALLHRRRYQVRKRTLMSDITFK